MRNQLALTFEQVDGDCVLFCCWASPTRFPRFVRLCTLCMEPFVMHRAFGMTLRAGEKAASGGSLRPHQD